MGKSSGPKDPVVMFDVDGVLADFVLGFTSLARRHHPEVPVTATYEQPSWKGFPGMSEAVYKETWDRVNDDPLFWTALRPLCGPITLKQINLLRGRGPVYFVTARHGYLVKEATETWLEQHGIYKPTVILSKRKGEIAKAVGATHCIDDKAANASNVDWLTDGATKSYLLDRPYNAVDTAFLGSGVVRIHTVQQYLEEIETYGVRGQRFGDTGEFYFGDGARYRGGEVPA